jgi:hypothetical protein
MHHPVSGPDQLMFLKVIFEPAQKRGQRLFMGGAYRQSFIDQRSSSAVFRREMNTVADARALAFAKDALPCWSFMPGEHRELDARRTGVHDEDCITHGFTPS